MRYSFILLIITLSSLFISKSFAQKNVNALLEERANLMEALNDLEEEKRNLLGKRSKKDLRNSTEILREIIEKDNEIIAILKREVIKNESKKSYPTIENNNKVLELESQLAQLTSTYQVKDTEKLELEQELEVVKDRVFSYQSVILVMFAVTFFMGIYILQMKSR